MWRNIVYTSLLSALPWGAENIYHVQVVVTGYLHDPGYNVVITPIRNGEEPTGWDTLEQDIARAAQRMCDNWAIAKADYAYSFRKL